MEDEVLFQVKKSELESGLRGIPVGYCVTSTVHPEKGLFYADIPISELASWEPERVICLLQTGKDPTAEELSQFKSELKKRAPLSKASIVDIEKLPTTGDPMKLLTAAILLVGMREGKNDWKEDALNLIAKIPEITARVINHHASWGKTPPFDPNLGYMENFAAMLNIPRPREKELAEVLRLFNILHFDHGGGNLSTFVGKAVASGLEDMYGSIGASILALAGPRHGGANQECLYFLKEAIEKLGEAASAADVEKFVRDKLANKEVIFGFGHAVLRVEDPRATVQYNFASKHFPKHPLVKMALLMRSEGSKVLKENPKISDPYPNVDAISGSLLSAAGFPYPDYYTLLFALSRTVGIAIQIVYERLEARGGKGTPIIRPKYIYKSRG